MKIAREFDSNIHQKILANRRIKEILDQFNEVLSGIEESENKYDYLGDRPIFNTDTEIEVDKKIDNDYFWKTLRESAKEKNISFSIEEDEGDGLYYLGLRKLKPVKEASEAVSGGQLDGVVVGGGGPVSTVDVRKDFEEAAKKLRELIKIGDTTTGDGKKVKAEQLDIQPDGTPNPEKDSGEKEKKETKKANESAEYDTFGIKTDFQKDADNEIKKFGKVSGRLLTELDDNGYYLDSDNKVIKKVNESMVETSNPVCKEAYSKLTKIRNRCSCDNKTNLRTVAAECRELADWLKENNYGASKKADESLTPSQKRRTAVEAWNNEFGHDNKYSIVKVTQIGEEWVGEADTEEEAAKKALELNNKNDNPYVYYHVVRGKIKEQYWN